ncbi:MAG: hypothetical protein J6J78_08990 [Clostridia bacterium]|nr:hypothetical protein [Clostridia bacterium]
MKKYPFSVRKHAHDIEFRINRVWLEMHDMESGEIEWDEATYDKLDKLHDDLLALRDSIMYNGDGYVAFLTGKEIGLAKETVAWASGTRANSLIKAGKTQYLQYC